MSRPLVIADNAIPFLQGVLEPYADVQYFPGNEIGPQQVKNADALIIRTRTKCNSALLDGSSVKKIATATIGTDHIDLEYCRNAGIQVASAAGCNSGGVMNYVFSALYGTASRKSVRLEGRTFGIIGVGNVGKKVEKMARALGFKVMLCDPPRAEKEGPEGFSSLEDVLRDSSIITLHVPLSEETRGMANDDFFNLIQGGSIFINASRGEVVDDEALKRACPRLGTVIIDTWNHEPDIDRELLDMVDIATPHIAGYSFQGKQNGTSMAVQAVAKHLGIEPLYDFFPVNDNPDMEPIKLDVSGKNQGEIASLLQYNYPIFSDDFMLRMFTSDFEKQRNEYNYRREFYI